MNRVCILPIIRPLAKTLQKHSHFWKLLHILCCWEQQGCSDGPKTNPHFETLISLESSGATDILRNVNAPDNRPAQTFLACELQTWLLSSWRKQPVRFCLGLAIRLQLIFLARVSYTSFRHWCFTVWAFWCIF